MKRILFVLIAALGFGASTGWAQTGTARGKVTDEAGKALEGVVVHIEFLGGVKHAVDTKTNKKGEYTQVGLQPGQYKISAAKEGYRGAYAETKIGLGDATYVPDLKLDSGAGKAAAAQAENEELNAIFKKGFDAAQAGKLDEAEAAYKEVIAKSPAVPQAYFNLGFVQAQKKDWAAAEASFKKSLELKPDYDEAKALLMNVYADSGQKDKAMAMAAEAGNSKNPRTLMGLGVMYLNAGDADKAHEAFTKAEAADATLAEVQYFLGTIAVQKGNTDEGVARLEKYLSMNPTNPQSKSTAEGLLQALKGAKK